MTFIEAIVWVAIFTMAMVAITETLISFYRANAYTLEQGAAVESARAGITATVKEIREAQYGSDGAYPIVSIAPDSFSFYSDVNDDPYVEEVTYTLDGTNFVRGVLSPSGDPLAYAGTAATSTVSDNVRNAAQGVNVFTYYDKNGNVITDYSKTTDVRYVVIDLVVNVNPSRAPHDLTLESSAALRNLVAR
ncbi:MAG TPA: hypothetical protein VFL98_02820 [Candidatus Paceibacterota bacterium]|nr:hypothetical protein [Candidatus Paceibacterota bacterium]